MFRLEIIPPPTCFSLMTVSARLEICQVGGLGSGSPHGVMEKTSGGHPLQSIQHRHRGELRRDPSPELRPNAPAR